MKESEVSLASGHIAEAKRLDGIATASPSAVTMTISGELHGMRVVIKASDPDFAAALVLVRKVAAAQLVTARTALAALNVTTG